MAGDDVEMVIAQPKSLMPELLVKDMTAKRLANLLAFLESHTLRVFVWYSIALGLGVLGAAAAGAF